MEQTWHLLRTWPPRLQPTPWQWAWGTGVLENGQGFGVSISSTDGAACPVRKSRHLVSLLYVRISRWICPQQHVCPR